MNTFPLVDRYAVLRRPDYIADVVIYCSFVTLSNKQRFVVKPQFGGGFLITNHESLEINTETKAEKVIPFSNNLFEFKDRENVFKLKGYKFPGTIVGRFLSLSPDNAIEEQYVVEAGGDYAGMLHIFNGKQLALEGTIHVFNGRN